MGSVVALFGGLVVMACLLVGGIGSYRALRYGGPLRGLGALPIAVVVAAAYLVIPSLDSRQGAGGAGVGLFLLAVVAAGALATLASGVVLAVVFRPPQPDGRVPSVR